MYKKHSSFSFIALLFMPLLSEHELSGPIGMLKAGMCVSGIARYNNCHPINCIAAPQRLLPDYLDSYKDWRRSGQPRLATGYKTATYVDCVSTIFTLMKSVRVG